MRITEKTAVAALFVVVLTGAPPGATTLRVISLAANAMTVELPARAMTPLLTSDPRFVFSVSSVEGASATVHMVQGAGRAEIPATGFSGATFRTWIAFTPPAAQPGQLRPRITISFDRPVYRSLDPAACVVTPTRVDVPILSSTPAAAKQRTIAPLPFSHGVRIEVINEGIYEIDASTLASLGVPIERIASREYRLFEQATEVPLYLTNPHRSRLEHDDKLLFYGRALLTPQGRPTQYSESNMYWLCWNTGRAGVRVTEVSGSRRIDPTHYREEGDLELAARGFFDTLHIEHDSDIRWLGNVFEPEDLAFQPQPAITDNWYWGILGNREQTDFLFSIPSPARTRTLQARMTIGLVGLSSTVAQGPAHEYTVLVNGSTPSAGARQQVARWSGQNPFELTTDWFPVTYLEHGINTLSLQRSPDRVSRAALNWIRVEYPRVFQALEDQLFFSNNPADVDGLFEFTVQGFNSDALELWDIRQHRRFTDFDMVRSQSSRSAQQHSYTLIFQDSLSTPTRYLAQTRSRRLRPAALTLDTLLNDTRFPSPLDYVIITTSSFREPFEDLARHYRENGLQAAVFDITALYNRFSAGVRNPDAIRDFLVWLRNRFPHSPPSYLLLGGDTTHDLDKKNKEHNHVPTHLTRVPGWGPCSNDGYFATLHAESTFPDLAVGRFPVRTLREARDLVSKTIRYRENLPRGFWRDNLLMISGAESEFTHFNTSIINRTIGQHMNVLRMDAHTNSPYYKDAASAPRLIADQVNAGVYAINFNGHGGGNTWSDNRFFSYNDLDRLHNGRWGGGGKLPIVFSFTCLTGFFESVFYRSLGEEFLRLPLDGAIAFYGASAYTSQTGNFVMNRLLLERALTENVGTIGELIRLTETEMLVRYGPSQLPLVRQYNLLGDPALPWRLVADSMTLSLNKSSFSGNDTLVVTARTAPVDSGYARITVGSESSIWHERIVPVAGTQFTVSFPLKPAALTARGWVRAFAWNENGQVRAEAVFSKDMLLVHDISINPPLITAGASFMFSSRIGGIDPDSISGAVVLYETGPGLAPLQNPSSVFLALTDSDGLWTASDSLTVRTNSSPDDVLKIQVRIMTPTGSLESRLFTFALRGRPDLGFVTERIEPYWYHDSVRVDLSVLNAGTEAVPCYSTLLRFAPEGDTIALFTSTVPLAPGKMHRYTWALPDTQGVMALEAWTGNDTLEELRTTNNRIHALFSLAHARVRKTTDTLYSLQRGLAVSPLKTLSGDRDLFLLTAPCDTTPPLTTPSRWLPVHDEGCFSSTLGVRPEENDTLVWTFTTVNDTGPGTMHAAFFDTRLDAWRYETPPLPVGTPSVLRIATHLRGPFTPAMFEDKIEPRIRATVHGREMRFLDYAARNKPFHLHLTDPSGIIPSSIQVLLNSVSLDTATLSDVTSADGYRTVSLTAYPAPQRSVDSLTIQARDFAGNLARRTFAYMPGEELSIAFLSCHPNPFAATQSPDGLTLHPPRFAFMLTDVADEVTLTVYTVSGRVVRNWRFIDMIGYREVEWDGRTNGGNRIANGTYFVKMTARNERRRVEKRIRIAKLEGY